MTFTQVFDISKEQPTPIIGLEYHRVGKSNLFYILALTLTKLYQFVDFVFNKDERPMFQQVFNNYSTIPGNFFLLLNYVPLNLLILKSFILL